MLYYAMLCYVMLCDAVLGYVFFFIWRLKELIGHRSPSEKKTKLQTNELTHGETSQPTPQNTKYER